MCRWVTNTTVSVVQDHRQVVLSRRSSEWIKSAAYACLSSQYTGGEVRGYSTSLGYRVRPCINKVKRSWLGIKNLSILSWPLWRLDLVLTGKVQRYISRCICGVFPETVELFKCAQDWDGSEPEMAEAHSCTWIPPQQLWLSSCPRAPAPDPTFFSLFVKTVTSNFPESSQASILGWGCNLDLPCFKALGFSDQVAARFLAFAACR